jgi:hypothetical protein
MHDDRVDIIPRSCQNNSLDTDIVPYQVPYIIPFLRPRTIAYQATDSVVVCSMAAVPSC